MESKLHGPRAEMDSADRRSYCVEAVKLFCSILLTPSQNGAESIRLKTINPLPGTFILMASPSISPIMIPPVLA